MTQIGAMADNFDMDPLYGLLARVAVDPDYTHQGALNDLLSVPSHASMPSAHWKSGETGASVVEMAAPAQMDAQTQADRSECTPSQKGAMQPARSQAEAELKRTGMFA